MTEQNRGLLSPEGLTVEQEKLADLLYTTRTSAKVNRRQRQPDGFWKFYALERPTAPVDFAQNDEEFVLKLHEKNPDAPLSPYYVNLRNLPDLLNRQIAVVLKELDSDLQTDFVTGIPQAGIPLAKAYSELTGVVYRDIFEKEVTPEGRKIIPGTTEDLKRKMGIVVDDLVTQGGSKVEMIDAARQLEVEIAIRVLVDREQGGLDQIRKSGYDIKAAMTWSQLVNFGIRKGHINEEQNKRIQDYLIKSA